MPSGNIVCFLALGGDDYVGIRRGMEGERSGRLYRFEIGGIGGYFDVVWGYGRAWHSGSWRIWIFGGSSRR